METDFYCNEVLSGRVAVEAVRETPLVLAFRHTRPHWPAHVVVIPKVHVPSFIETGAHGEAVLAAVLATVRDVAAEMSREHGGCHIVTNVGKYQESKHLHFHIGAGEPL